MVGSEVILHHNDGFTRALFKTAANLTQRRKGAKKESERIANFRKK
jgi:hypothetical protein